MLHWRWKRIMGELVYKYDGKTYHDRLYQGNCLAVIGERYLGNDGKYHWRYGDYWADLEILQTCLERKMYDFVSKVRFNGYYLNAEMKKAMFLFIKAKIPVEVYWPKKDTRGM